MKVTQKGKIRVNIKAKPHKFKERQVLFIDLHSKRGEAGIGSCGDIPYVWLSPNDESLHLRKTKQEITEISFPEYKGWTIACAEISRYTLIVALIKY